MYIYIYIHTHTHAYNVYHHDDRAVKYIWLNRKVFPFCLC